MDKRDERNTASHQRARRPAFRERRERPQKKEAPLSAREVARRALSDVARSGSYVSAALDRHLNATRLSADDKRLAASLFFTAVENRLLLEARLAQFWTERPEPVVEDILHIAAAQILLMDRIPDHAAVDEAVKQTRASGRDGLSALVNGILRNLIRARDAGELPRSTTPPCAIRSRRNWPSASSTLMGRRGRGHHGRPPAPQPDHPLQRHEDRRCGL